MGIALLLTTLLGCGYLFYLAYSAWQRRQYRSALTTAKWLLVWVVAYFVVLLTVSLASQERMAGGGEEVRFCGIWGECNLTASVLQVDRRKMLASLRRELMADGNYYLVTVKVTSYVPNPDLRPQNLTGYIVDADGGRYARFEHGEREFLRNLGGDNPYELTTGPSGGSYKRVMIFDLPTDVRNPTLVLQHGSWLDRFVELFLIGDEGSLFHKRTKLLLEPTERQPVSSKSRTTAGAA